MDMLKNMEAKLDELNTILDKVLPIVEQYETVEKHKEALRKEEGKLKNRWESAFGKVADQRSTDPESCNEILGSERDLRNKAKQYTSSSKVRRLPTRSTKRVS